MNQLPAILTTIGQGLTVAGLTVLLVALVVTFRRGQDC